VKPAHRSEDIGPFARQANYDDHDSKAGNGKVRDRERKTTLVEFRDSVLCRDDHNKENK